MRSWLIDRFAPFDSGLRPSAHAARCSAWLALTNFEYTHLNEGTLKRVNVGLWCRVVF